MNDIAVNLTLEMDIATFQQNQDEIKQRIAQLYGVSPELIELEAQGGSVVVIIRLASASDAEHETLSRHITAVDDAEITRTLGINASRAPEILFGFRSVKRPEIQLQECAAG